MNTPLLLIRPEFPGLGGIGWLLLPLLAVAVFFYWRLYRNDGKRLTASQRWVLWSCRCLAALLVFVALMQPSVETTRNEERLPVVALLLDQSSSMNFPDARGEAFTQSRAKGERTRFNGALEALDILQSELSANHRVKLFTFSDTLQLARDIPCRGSEPAVNKDELRANLPAPAGDYTEAGDAVAGALDKLEGERVSAVVLLSDGRLTGGQNYAATANKASQAGAPVHTLAFGSEDPLPDLRIDRMDAPAEAALGDVLNFQLEITNWVQADLSITLKLFEQGQLNQEKPLHLKKGKNRVTVSTIPKTEGLREYKAVLPKLDDEVDYSNNEAAVNVKVVKKTLRVLFVAGKPTREYMHAAVCLLRDPIIRVSCFLQSAHVNYVQQGNVVIDHLPRTVSEWQDYDVVMLYDIDPKELSEQQVSGLENTVAKGAGLLFVAGRNYGLGPLLQIHANKMRQLLPVDIEKDRAPDFDEMFETPFTVELPAGARGHSILRLVSSEALNDDIWSHFPALYWHHPVVGPKPKAVTLMRRTGSPGNRGDTLLAIQRYGEGASVYLGTDEIWRWRNPYGAHDYELFWSHIIRYLGESRLMGAQKQVALATDKLVYAPGEKATVQLQILDHALLQQLEGESLFATVRDPNNAKQLIPLQRDARGLPQYNGSYSARYLGAHRVEARHLLASAGTDNKDLFNIEDAFQVEARSLELLDTSADLDGMKLLAEKSGGEALDYRTLSADAVRKLARSVPAEKLLIPHESVVELWDTWAVLGLIFALLAAEWSLRKLWGLL